MKKVCLPGGSNNNLLESVKISDNILKYFSYEDKICMKCQIPENEIWHFMQIVSLGDNLHEMSDPIF